MDENNPEGISHRRYLGTARSGAARLTKENDRHMNSFFKHTLYILACCCQTMGLSAQSADDAAMFNHLMPDAATAAMGGNGTALAPDAASVFINTAQGAFAGNKMLFAYTLSPWMPEWAFAENRLMHHISGLYTIGRKQAVLAGARYLRFPAVELTDENGNTQGSLTPYGLDVSAGYAHALWKNLSVGATLRYMRLDQKMSVTDHMAVDLSLFYRHPFSHEHPWLWQAGLQVANLGKAVLPLKIEYAASGGRVWDKHRATATAGISHLESADGYSLLTSVGAEYAYRQKAFLRCGYQSGDRDKGIYSFTSLGGGGRIQKLRLDAAWRLASAGNPQKNTWLLTLGFAL